jgi:hypothetical protein
MREFGGTKDSSNSALFSRKERMVRRAFLLGI